MTSDSGRGGLTARRWELQVASEWLADRRSANSDSARFAADFGEAVTRFFVGAVGDNVDLANKVVDQLGPTLSRCDELDFDEFEQALAYLLWHEVDRYHRVTQALDLLFERGVLPIAKPTRELRVLEVGSGPAPGSYAAVDYFAALGAWTQQGSSDFVSSGSVDVRTLDKGPAWGRVIHGLSEELSVLDPSSPTRAHWFASRFFGVTYPELAGFNPRHLHTQSRDEHRRRFLEATWADDDPHVDFDSWFVSDRQDADILAAQAAPPSAYDIIVVANFVTSEQLLQELEADLQVLARSLVPGGVLLTLSGTGTKYIRLWDQFSKLARRSRLDHAVDEVLSAHCNPAIHAQVAGATITALRHLHHLTPNSLSNTELPPAIRDEVDAAMLAPAGDPGETATEKFGPYPRFQVHAFKRGRRAIPFREQRRISQRRYRNGGD